jgi:GT2 family glycosyltransferase
MRLSIVIPTHSRTDLLLACLESVSRHAPTDTEVIVVDDASPQPVSAIVADRFPSVRVIRLPDRRGFCVAANCGIAAARAEIVELLNDDTEVQPGWVEAALDHFDNPKLGAVAPLVLRWPDGQIIDSAGDIYYLGGVARKRGHGQPLCERFLCPGCVLSVSACAAFYRRSALLEVGGFPEEFGAYFDDVDLSLRLRRAGYELYYESASRVLHYGGASHGAHNSRLLEQQSRNEERLFWRNLPAGELWKAVPQHAAVLAGKALLRWQDGHLLPFFVGRLRALAELPELLARRAELRRHGAATYQS